MEREWELGTGLDSSIGNNGTVIELYPATAITSPLSSGRSLCLEAEAAVTLPSVC